MRAAAAAQHGNQSVAGLVVDSSALLGEGHVLVELTSTGVEFVHVNGQVAMQRSGVLDKGPPNALSLRIDSDEKSAYLRTKQAEQPDDPTGGLGHPVVGGEEVDLAQLSGPRSFTLAVDERMGCPRRSRPEVDDRLLVGTRVAPDKVNRVPVTGAVGDHRLRPYATASLSILAVAAAYYGAARLGMLVVSVGEPLSSLWLPAGIGLVALLLLGLRVWPGIALGAFFVNASEGALPVAGAISVGDTLAPVCAFLLLRLTHFRLELDRLRDALLLVFLGSFAGMLVSATFGSVAVVVAGQIPAEAFWRTWGIWWTSDVMGVLVVVPFLLALRTLSWPPRVRWSRWVEAVALYAGTLVVMIVATRSLSVFFLAFPLLVWGALRFQLAGVAPCALIVSLVAVHAAVNGYGAFAGQDTLSKMLILQLFNGCVVLTGLLLAVIITEWVGSRKQIEQTVVRLGQVVEHLERSEPPGYEHLSGLRDKPAGRGDKHRRG